MDTGFAIEWRAEVYSFDGWRRVQGFMDSDGLQGFMDSDGLQGFMDSDGLQGKGEKNGGEGKSKETVYGINVNQMYSIRRRYVLIASLEIYVFLDISLYLFIHLSPSPIINTGSD